MYWKRPLPAWCLQELKYARSFIDPYNAETEKGGTVTSDPLVID